MLGVAQSPSCSVSFIGYRCTQSAPLRGMTTRMGAESRLVDVAIDEFPQLQERCVVGPQRCLTGDRWRRPRPTKRSQPYDVCEKCSYRPSSGCTFMCQYKCAYTVFIFIFRSHIFTARNKKNMKLSLRRDTRDPSLSSAEHNNVVYI